MPRLPIKKNRLSHLTDISDPNPDGTRTFTGVFRINDQPGQMCDLSVTSQAASDERAESHTYTLTCANAERVFRSRSIRSLLYDMHAESSPSGGSTRSSYYTLDADQQFHQQFRAFQQQFDRRYSNVNEVMMRQRIFRANLAQIELLNQHEQGSAEYGVTQFADMSASEFRRWTGLRQRAAVGDENEVRHASAVIPDVPVPRAFDWREKGVITAVKNQGACGSCWAFSVTGNIEGLHAIRTGKLEEYSEQELVDCDTVDSGCNGGLPDNAYK